MKQIMSHNWIACRITSRGQIYVWMKLPLSFSWHNQFAVCFIAWSRWSFFTFHLQSSRLTSHDLLAVFMLGVVMLVVVVLTLLIIVCSWSWLSSCNQLQWLLDCFWDRWWFWQMVSFGSEAKFISNVTDFNELSIWCCVRVRTLSDLSLVWASTVLQISTFVSTNSISSWVGILIAAIRIHFILEGSDWNDVAVWLIRSLILLMLGGWSVVMLLVMVSLVLVVLTSKRLRLNVVVLLLVEVVVALKGLKLLKGSKTNSNKSYLLWEAKAKLTWAQMSADNANNWNKNQIKLLSNRKAKSSYDQHFNFWFLLKLWLKASELCKDLNDTNELISVDGNIYTKISARLIFYLKYECLEKVHFIHNRM